jgi:PRD1 phage membrane DNA delivery
MTDRIFADIMAILTAIVGLAIIAVIVSKQADTSNVLTSGGNAFSNIIKAAVSPVSGSGGIGSLPSLSSGTGGF